VSAVPDPLDGHPLPTEPPTPAEALAEQNQLDAAVEPVPPVVITEDGVYDGLTDEQYHGDPVPGGSLSSTGARQLLPPSCPAKFRWEQDNGRAPKRAWDLGHAAHHQVLGVGAELVVVQTGTKDGPTGPAEDYRTKYAQQHRNEIRAEGKVPLLAEELATVKAMAAAIREHPVASVLFDPDLGGQPEQSLFWTDPAFGVVRRARLDWRPPVRDDGRLIVPDYKSTTAADLRSIEKSVGSFGYAMQDDWYRAVLRGLGLAESPAFVFVFQEKDPPYLITIVEVDAPSLRVARRKNIQALEVFAECTATGEWPPYSTDVELVSLPRWELIEYGEIA
jgi:hypothetical protein